MIESKSKCKRALYLTKNENCKWWENVVYSMIHSFFLSLGYTQYNGTPYN